MTYSYNPDFRGDLDRVRFHIEDNDPDTGPLPSDKHFEDEEIESILALEGTWQRTVAACFERLAAAWRKYPNLESDQFGLSRSHIASGYAQDAKEWRKQYGYADQLASTRTLARGFFRADGWGADAVVGAADDL